MHYIIGKKAFFAVELEVTGNKWDNRTAIWINDTRVGDWDDENLLAPFVRAVYRIAVKYDEFWLEELDGLDCYQTYLTVHPCYNDPDSFYLLSEDEMDKLVKFDKFLLFWGENFDAWGLTVVYGNGVYKFMWAHSPHGKEDTFEVRNDIKCCAVEFVHVQAVYEELRKVISEENWPNDL